MRRPLEDGAGELAVGLGHVRLEQRRQLLHRQVGPGAHEGELEEADDHRRQGVVALAAGAQVEHQPAVGQARQLRVQLRRRAAELAGQRLQPHRADGQAGGQGGLVGRIEQVQNLREGGRGGRAGHLPVEGLLQAVVVAVGVGVMVGHGRTPVG